MPDEIDRANELAEKHLELAIAAARGIQAPEVRSAEACAICGYEIPSARQVAMPGTQMCRDCAEEWGARIRRGL